MDDLQEEDDGPVEVELVSRNRDGDRDFSENKKLERRQRELEKQEEEQKVEPGDIDLTDTGNLQLETVTLSLTHRDTFHQVVTSPIRNKFPQEAEMSTAEVRAVVDRLAQEGVETLVLTGGEPTLRDDFHTVLQYAINNIENVVVETGGGTNRNLSRYDCTVSIPLDFWNPIDNNEIRRMTNPQEYLYHRNKRELVPQQYDKCEICGEEGFKTELGAKGHLKKKHEEYIVEDFKSRNDVEDIGGYKQVKEHGKFKWGDYLARPESVPIMEKEMAKRLAVRKAKMVDNPVIIRTNIMNNNDLDVLVAFSQYIGADLHLTPLYPNGNKKLEEQIPSPKRFLKVMEMAWQLDAEIKENIVVESPFFKAYTHALDKQEEVQPKYSEEEHEEWVKRGRVSEVGVSKIHVMPDGSALPSKHLRNDDWILGNLVSQGMETIYDSLAQFNNEVIDEEKDYRGFELKYPDVRRRSLAGDPNIYLTKPYPEQIQGGE